MKRVRITESQAKILGLIKINENAGDESGVKSAGGALGPKPIRIVISGDSVPKLKDVIIKAIKRQDPDTSVAYYEATGKIVGNVSEYKLEAVKRDVKFIDPMISLEKKSLTKALKENKKSVLKITKEQYNKLVESGLIKEEKEVNVKGGLTRVDKTFKKEFAKHDIQNLKKESKFNIAKPNPSLSKSVQGKFGVSEMSKLMNETKNLIEYMYGKTENFPPFWNKFGLTYEEICEAFLNEGMIVENDGCWKLSKSMGTPDMAINTVMEKLNKMINDGRELEMESDGYLPAGAEYDKNAPWNQDSETSTPTKPKQRMFNVVYYNREIVILNDKEGNQYAFIYDSIPREDFEEYAEIPRVYIGKDEDGDPEFEYSDDWDIDEDVLDRYINDNLKNISYGVGLGDFEEGKDIVKIDSELKADLMKLYDKDKGLVRVLSAIEEDYDSMQQNRNDLTNKFVGNVIKAMTPQGERKPKTKEEVRQMARTLAKLYKKPVKFYLDKLNKEYGIEETTTAASSGSYTGPFLGSAAKAPEDPNKLDVPVVGEVTAGSGSVGAYDANALPNITRDGKFKSNPTTPKAFKKTQYPKGGFVKFNDCVKLNNKPAGAGCSQGAVDNVVKVVQTKGNINAPSLGEGNN